MENVLETIVMRSRIELAARKERTPLAQLERQIAERPQATGFRSSLSQPGIRVIAELKKASPSRGLIRPDFPVSQLAKELEGAGAAALSILTEPNYFLGGCENLFLAARQVSIPLLRKDFIYDPYQIYEARALGASAVLLIAAMLKAPAYRLLRNCAIDLGLDVLSEAHNAEEIQMLAGEGADIIGVNARNLSNFHTDLLGAVELIDRIPAGILPVAESAIQSAEDIRRLQQSGARAFLIGETLMRAASPGEKLCELLSR